MKRLHVIACPSIEPELRMLARRGVSLRFLEMGLHQRSAEALRQALQNAIDDAGDGDAVALGYGLCNRGIIGLYARDIPVAIPRSYDCIGTLLGPRYRTELDAEPGTFFLSAGWLNSAPSDLQQPDFTFGPNSNVTRDRLAQRYGEDNADYLLTALDGMMRHYSRLAYVATLPGAEPEAAARQLADRHHWRFDRLKGDTGWLARLVSGEWNEREFLVVKPGQRVVATFDDRLIGAA